MVSTITRIDLIGSILSLLVTVNAERKTTQLATHGQNSILS